MDGFELAQIVSPPLKHFTAFIQIGGMVIGITNGILLLVGKLGFDDVAVKAPFQLFLVQDGGEHGAETVDGHLLLAETHPADTVQKRHVRNTLRG